MTEPGVVRKLQKLGFVVDQVAVVLTGNERSSRFMEHAIGKQLGGTEEQDGYKHYREV